MSVMMTHGIMSQMMMSAFIVKSKRFCITLYIVLAVIMTMTTAIIPLQRERKLELNSET